jgi:hypothetical protein
VSKESAIDSPTSNAPAGKAQAADVLRIRERLTNAIRARTGLGALVAGLRRGFHPQLLLAWIIVTMLPALVAALPITAWLFEQFGHSPRAGAIAAGRDTALVIDAVSALGGFRALLGGSGVFAFMLAVALSPWLTGMIVAQIRTVYRLRMGGVLRAGLGEYPRMLRMLLWALVPMGAAIAIGMGALWLAQEQGESAVLAARVADASRPAIVLLGALLMLAHMTVEAGRGWLGADLALSSVFEAWKRGVKLLVQKPAATLAVYLGTSAVGYGLALMFGKLRLLVDPSSWTGWVLALVLTQLVIAALAWGRSARLHGLADLATGTIMAQQPVSPAEAEEQLREAAKRQSEPAIP